MWLVCDDTNFDFSVEDLLVRVNQETVEKLPLQKHDRRALMAGLAAFRNGTISLYKPARRAVKPTAQQI
jgi:hypothetical protein